MFFYDVSTQWFRMKNYYIWSMSVMVVSSIYYACCLWCHVFLWCFKLWDNEISCVFDISLSHHDLEYGTMRVFWDFYRTFMRLLHLQDLWDFYEQARRTRVLLGSREHPIFWGSKGKNRSWFWGHAHLRSWGAPNLKIVPPGLCIPCKYTVYMVSK